LRWVDPKKIFGAFSHAGGQEPMLGELIVLCGLIDLFWWLKR
jgi:hypothetical protein